MRNSIVLVGIPGGWPRDAPPRSAFFGLAPEGSSGESFEDLESFFRRTSANQRVSPRALAARAIWPLFLDRPSHSRHVLGTSYCDLTMNGVSEVAVAWVDALERLTLRNDLSLRTLLPLRGAVSTFRLLSKTERFCPSCYRDDESTNRPKYNRLLWSIACVEACPLHATLLEPVPGAGKIKPNTYSVPGLSRLDGASLANYPPRTSTAEQAQSARLVAELLADVHQHPDAFANCAPPSKFLMHAANTLFEGRIGRLAKHIGIADAQVYNWCFGDRHPSFPHLVRLAQCFDCGISDVLLGNRVVLKKIHRSPDARPLVAKHLFGAAKTAEQLLAELHTAYESGSAFNLTRAAVLLGVTERFLHRLAPDISASLVQRGREVRHRKKYQREEGLFSVYFEAFQELCLADRYPGMRKVSERVYQRIGSNLDWSQVCRFHSRAVHRWRKGIRPSI